MQTDDGHGLPRGGGGKEKRGGSGGPGDHSRRRMMETLNLSAALMLLFASSLAAQSRSVAERLGYPAETKLLILHADDLGVAHSVNAASFDALDKGAISSASIMIPTPWVGEVAAYARTHPNADLGLHLTLTSVCQTYRWGSVEYKATVQSS